MRPHCASLAIVAFLLLQGSQTCPQVLINEYVAINVDGIQDEDGDRVDWIELYNPDPLPVDLAGFGLSDDEADPFKWVFPQLDLSPGAWMLVFASGKDRPYIWQTIITQGDSWKYRLGDTEPPASWTSVSFDDTLWAEGPSGLGYGDGDDATIVSPTISLYLRRSFEVPDPGVVEAYMLQVDYDDAFVAYLNGVEIARANIGPLGARPPHDALANSGHEAQMYQGGQPDAFFAPLESPLILQAGTNLLAIQVHNASPTSSDMTLIPFFSLASIETPPAPLVALERLPAAERLPAPDRLPVSGLFMHTNFKIDGQGEILTLSDSAGQVLDQLDSGVMGADISRGREPDGGDDWRYFVEPTPGGPNNTPGYPGFVAAPEFSLPAGFYSGILSVSITSSTPEARIFYTADGGEPTDSSTAYTLPIAILETTSLRARAFGDGYLPSSITTQSYLIDESTSFPVVSLVMDPPDLWDYYTGIYVMGPDANPEFPHYGANFWQDWERPIHAEYFARDGGLGFSLDAGVEIHGGWGRAYDQKSFRLIARGQYGPDTIEYAVFPEQDLAEYRRLLLRNGGHDDWLLTHMRDAVIHQLASCTDLDRQAYDPAVTFLNGQYWGIYNLRERQDEFYLESHHGIDPDEVDMLEGEQQVVEGDAEHFLNLLAFLETHDLSDETNYEYVRTQMDVDNFAEYNVFEIYTANRDWPARNRRYWRPRVPNGRWRWLLYDLDVALKVRDHNTIAWATDPASSHPANAPWSTFVLRKLFENEGFEQSFINRYADRMNTIFLPELINEIVDQTQQHLEAEMPRHLTRWGRTVEDWHEDIYYLHRFINERPPYARSHLMEHFDLTGTYELTLSASPAEGGDLALTGITIDSTFTGTYYIGVPVPLTAIPAPGYGFAGWSDLNLPQMPAVVLDPLLDYSVIAYFAPGGLGMVINEINYHSAATFDPEDWVEFHNASPYAVDMTGWEFKDEEEEHVFTFPVGTVVPPQDYLVLCRSLTQFLIHFPDVTSVIGVMDFGLSGGGEVVRLFDAGGALVDSVHYDDVPPWPPEPDGGGPTLELRHPELDNTLAASWAASLAEHGTPAAQNSVYSGTAVTPQSPPGPELRLRLDAVYPNPFNPRANLRFAIPRRSHARLAVYAVGGRLVRTLENAVLPAGEYERVWWGRDDVSRPVSSGVYFVRLVVGEDRLQRKLLLLR